MPIYLSLHRFCRSRIEPTRQRLAGVAVGVLGLYSARMSHYYFSAPVCVLCNEPMQVARTIPAVAQLPEVLVFHCEGCGDVETREHGCAA
jgi:hypothetical protein